MFIWRANHYGDRFPAHEELNFQSIALERHTAVLAALRACSRTAEMQALLRTLSRTGVLRCMLERPPLVVATEA